MTLLVKPNLNSIEVLIFMTLIDSNVSHYELFLINNSLKENDNTKKEIKIEDFNLFLK